jgi:hypothetical protein
MTSLLVLLALASVASLAARRGAFTALFTTAVTPMLVGLGLLASPFVLGLLTPSTVAGLAPAIDVGICWLAMATGLRALQAIGAGSDAAGTSTRGRPLRLGAEGLLTVLVCAAGGALLVVALPLPAFAAEGAGRVAVLAGALIGASLSSIPDEPEAALSAPLLTKRAAVSEVTTALATFVALAFVPQALAPPVAYAGLALGLGAVFCLVQLLASGGGASGTGGGTGGDERPTKDEERRSAVTLLGVVTLATGFLRLLSLPTAPIGFVLGGGVARTRVGRALMPIVERTERPVRLVVTVLLAASCVPTWTALAWGAGFAAVHVGAQLAVARVGATRDTSPATALALTVASAPTPIVLAASFIHAGLLPSWWLLPTLIAVAFGDALAFGLRLAGLRSVASSTEGADAAGAIDSGAPSGARS